MIEHLHPRDELWTRIERALERVNARLERSAAALKSTGILYAVAGEQAAQLWVAQIDETAVRNTRDVDIVINRADLDAAKQVL